jgi:cysteinyl-tRNA synthetase
MKRFVKQLVIVCLVLLLQACNTDKKTDEAASQMINFITELASYARAQDADFIIIPQNGAELAFNDQDPSLGLISNYIDLVDGVGIEELYYNGDLDIDDERLDMCIQIAEHVPVMVADFVNNDNNIDDAITRSHSEGFICFPRSSTNYDYMLIPEDVPSENANNITNLNDAENYLYLISSDYFVSKEAMIEAVAATNYDLILTDLFFEGEMITSDEVQSFKTKANGAQRLAIAYINIGAAESYRYYWQSDWKKGNPNWLKKKYNGYDDEIWVEFWDQDWKDIIYGTDDSYVKKIIDAGFDGVYLDNIEAYYFLYNN